MKKKILIVLCISLQLFCFSATGSNSEAVKYGGILRDTINTNIRSLDPPQINDVNSNVIASQIYEGLVSVGRDYKLQPGLAESWDSKDLKTWRFHLRKRVFFHDDPCFPDGKGRELTAYDVKFSLERMLDPKSKCSTPWLFTEVVEGAMDFFKGKATEVKGFKVIDKYTFEIELINPYANLAQKLTIPFCYILPEEAVKKYGDEMTRHPVGTGPFKLKELKPDSKIILSKNEKYWQRDRNQKKLPYLDEVHVSIIKEGLTALSLFRQQSIDSTPVSSTQYSKVFSVEGKLTGDYSEYKFNTAELMTDYCYGFNLTDKILSNKKLRQAINYAVDREEIVKYLLHGRGVVAKGVIPPIIPAFDPGLKVYPYDPEKARCLLAEAGFPGGKGLPELTLKAESGEDHEAVATAIQSYLSKVGIKTRIEVTAINTIIEQAAQGKIQLFRWGWTAPFPDPEMFFMQFLSDKVPPQGFNFYRYESKKFDALYYKALKAASETERNELFQKMDKMIVDEAVWLFLYYPVVAKLDQPYVMNYRMDALERRNYKEVWINK